MFIRYYDKGVTLCQGDSAKRAFPDTDLLLSNLYGPIPAAYSKTPMLIHNFVNRKHLCEAWTGTQLKLVSVLNEGREAVWAGNIKEVFRVNLADLKPDDVYMDIQLPLRLLATYGKKGFRVWDGFMGRGTVGRACQILDMEFIGVDRDPKMVEKAMDYMGLKLAHSETR